MARLTGLEPATFAVTGRRSNQLSYSRIFHAVDNRPCQWKSTGRRGVIRLVVSYLPLEGEPMTKRPGAKLSFAPAAHIAAITPGGRVGGDEDGACVGHSSLCITVPLGAVNIYLVNETKKSSFTFRAGFLSSGSWRVAPMRRANGSSTSAPRLVPSGNARSSEA